MEPQCSEKAGMNRTARSILVNSLLSLAPLSKVPEDEQFASTSCIMEKNEASTTGKTPPKLTTIYEAVVTQI
jgi:hypothetical protein